PATVSGLREGVTQLDLAARFAQLLGHIPEANHAVFTSGDAKLAVRTEGDRIDGTPMTRKLPRYLVLNFAQVPQPAGAVGSPTQPEVALRPCRGTCYRPDG